MTNVRPLAVSMGDPAGVGPEIVVKAWAQKRLPAFFAIGDPGVYERAFVQLGLAPAVSVIQAASVAAGAFAESLPVLAVPLAVRETPGRPESANAEAVIEAIRQGAALCLAGEAAALVTCPIAKAVLYEAGFAAPGHTEFIADLTAHAPMSGPRGPVMMLAGGTLKVALATVHLPLKRAAETLNKDDIIRVVTVTDAALRQDFAIARPRIALAGLNPHAGEGGALGREEIEIINPAAAALRARGIAATDAQPPDTLFHEEARAGYDAVIAMYHDQGLIPLKTLHFWNAVNITLGLPIVRTSPDHGTAFDIAGRTAARADSFIAALRTADETAARRVSLSVSRGAA